jgi:hypothetical protein
MSCCMAPVGSFGVHALSFSRCCKHQNYTEWTRNFTKLDRKPPFAPGARNRVYWSFIAHKYSNLCADAPGAHNRVYWSFIAHKYSNLCAEIGCLNLCSKVCLTRVLEELYRMQDARLVLWRPILAEHSRWVRVCHTEHIQAVQRVSVVHISAAKRRVVCQVNARALCQAQIDVRLLDFWLDHASVSMRLVFNGGWCGGANTIAKEIRRK